MHRKVNLYKKQSSHCINNNTYDDERSFIQLQQRPTISISYVPKSMHSRCELYSYFSILRQHRSEINFFCDLSAVCFSSNRQKIRYHNGYRIFINSNSAQINTPVHSLFQASTPLFRSVLQSCTTGLEVYL